MSTNTENLPLSVLGVRRRDSREDTLQSEPRKRPCAPDPLVHCGRHFGRTVHALCSIRHLLFYGTNRLRNDENVNEREDAPISTGEEREYRIFQLLLGMTPGLKRRLMNGSDEEIVQIAELIQKGASSARSDDTKTLKSVIIDWITPSGQQLDPPLARNIKSGRGFQHECTGALLCPTGLDWSDLETREKLRSGMVVVPGDHWPIFVYQDFHYDAGDPWRGAFQSSLLLSAYKHIFTSPSSVGKEAKATRSGNARIHGMTQVTAASIAYVATQVRFALTSSSVFSKGDKVTDSERFYNSVFDLFDDPEEKGEVDELLTWWNQQIFPGLCIAKTLSNENTALARIKDQRAVINALRDSINHTIF